MLTESKPYTFDRVVRIVIGLMTLIALYWLLNAVASVLIPLAIGILLAYLLNPLVTRVQRRVTNRTAAVMITVVGLLLLMLLALVLVLPVVSREFARFVEIVAGLVSEGSPLRQRLASALPQQLYEQIDTTLKQPDLQNFFSEHPDLFHAGLTAVRWAVPQLLGVVTGTLAILGAAIQAFLVLLYLVFILIDYDRLSGQWQSYLPPKYRDSILAFLGEFNDAMSKYFRGQFVVASIVGVLFALGFWLVGVRLGILLGLLIGVLNMVPYLQIAGAVPAYLLALISAADGPHGVWWYLIGVTLVFIIVQSTQDAVITPRVMGQVTGLRPVVILFSVLFWGQLFGFLGLLLAIPLTCLGVAYYRRFLDTQSREMADQQAAGDSVIVVERAGAPPSAATEDASNAADAHDTT